MANANPTPRLVRVLPSGNMRIEIDRRIKRDGGAPERVRLRKALPRGITIDAAEAMAVKLEADLISRASAIAPASGWEQYVRDLKDTPKSWLYATVMNCRNRAKKRGIKCTLSAQQLRDLLLRSAGRCELTGLKFSTDGRGSFRSRPYFHSIDRIDSRGDYSIENLRVVCHAANIAMNAWGEDVFAELARGFVFNRYSAFYALKER